MLSKYNYIAKSEVRPGLAEKKMKRQQHDGRLKLPSQPFNEGYMINSIRVIVKLVWHRSHSLIHSLAPRPLLGGLASSAITP